MCQTPSFSMARAFIGSSGAWMLRLVRYSPSMTLAAFSIAAAESPSLTKRKPSVPSLLQTARLVDDRLVGHVGIRPLVPIDLQRRRGLLRAFVARRHGDDPAGGRGGLVLDHDGLDEARDLLGRRCRRPTSPSRRSAPAAARACRTACRARSASMPYLAVPFVFAGMSSCGSDWPIFVY